ncbi:MAG TPA: GNAT family N-acetyltransferase [Actinomycetota bacterium]|nr:GNAT family N-acetyltransferase [Actinomycetota bacterium]
MTVVTRQLVVTDAEACDAIVATLPYHFGDEEGRRECAAAVRGQRGLVAEDGGEVVGFLTLEPRFGECLEVTWMAVRADRRRQGIGRALLDHVANDSREEGRKFILALTVSPSDGPDEIPDGYQATRAFYEANGFILARDFPGYWKSDTPVLMVRPLNDLKV